MSWYMPFAVICAASLAAEQTVADRPNTGGTIQLWVDASFRSDGNGTVDRPFKTLEAALASVGEMPVRVHLATGLYRGPFRPRGRTEVEGNAAAVLFAEGSEVVVAPSGPLELNGVTVQGGRVGIKSSAAVHLSGVRFSGQREVALHVVGGSVIAERTIFSASVSEAGAVKLEKVDRAMLVHCNFRGPYRHAVELNGANNVHLTDCSFEGAVTGVHQIGGSAVVHRSQFFGGQGPALFSAHAELHLVDVDVHDHEYAVQCGEGSRLRALRFSSVRADRAGIALNRASADLEEILILDSGSFGAVQLVDATVELRRFWLRHPEAYGFNARQSRILLRDGVITDVTDLGGSAGDGIHLRNTQGSVESVIVQRVAGAGLLAAEDSSLDVRDFVVEDCHWGGIIAETLGRVRGSSVAIRNCAGPAVAVPDAAEVEVDVLRSERNGQGLAWVECAKGAKLRVSRAQGDPVGARQAPCLELLP